MLVEIFYWAFLAACSCYIILKGGAPERTAIGIAIAASVLTWLVASPDVSNRWHHVEIGVFLVDFATLIAFLVLALLADRFWTLWITGIHLIGIATHTAKLLSANVVPWVYLHMQALWAYPILLAMVFGTARHQKRLRLYGADNSWTPFFARSGQANQTAGQRP